MNATPATLCAEFAAAAAAVVAAPEAEKPALIAERDQKRTAYYRAAYEQQRPNLSHIQR